MGALMPMLEVTVVNEFSAMEPLRDEWNALVERAPTSTVFQTYEMHESWWKGFGETARAFIVLARDRGKLAGIAPLMVKTQKFLGRTQRIVQFIGARSFDYCDFITDCDRLEVLPLLVEKLADPEFVFDIIYLRDIREGSPTLDALQALRSRGYFVDMRVLYPAPSRIFNDPAADRALPNKKSLKRHYNYFYKAGRLQFKNCATTDEAAQYLGAFFDQHIKRRGVTDTPSTLQDEGMRTFFRELVRTLIPKGWLLFSVVLFNEKPIAMHFGFEYRRRIIWYKPAFDIDYAKHSPGEVLFKYLLEYALERKVHELDFTIGSEAFKYRFANHVRENYAVRVFRHWMPYRMNRLLLSARELVEKSPVLIGVARRALGRWRGQGWI